MSEVKAGSLKPAAIAVRLAALWLVTGALFKLFAGSPKMIPELVLSSSPFSWTLTYQIAIAIELAIVCVALVKPHRGWIPITAIFSFFLALLIDMKLKGKESCGCMGDSIKIDPLVMLALDAALLGFVLATKPWKNLAPPGGSAPLMIAGVLVGIALPWIVWRPEQASQPTVTSGGTVTNGGAVTNGGTGTVDGAKPVPRGAVIEFKPEDWVGQVIYDVEAFTRVVPADKIPSDGRIVLWRQSCDHCAAHLRDMANEKTVTSAILLVQVMDDLKSSPAVDAKPTGGHVTEVQLPPAEGLFTTPVEIRVEGGLVKAVLYDEDMKKEKGQ